MLKESTFVNAASDVRGGGRGGGGDGEASDDDSAATPNLPKVRRTALESTLREVQREVAVQEEEQNEEYHTMM